jgi:hypothetical protein
VLMNLCNILFIVVILSAASFAQECEAVIIVSSDIENTEYFLNGNKVAEGKKGIINSRTGSYTLTARESGNLWNPLSFSDTINIIDCGEYKFSFIFSSVLYLKSEPADAYVFRNDSLIGNTPVLITRGDDPVKLIKPGYKEAEFDGNAILNTVNLEKTRIRDEKNFYERSLFKYLIGGLIVFGGTTAYLKLEADKKFDQYQMTGNDDYLRQTRRYDLISGITFGAVQVNFGLLLYYFLKE